MRFSKIRRHLNGPFNSKTRADGYPIIPSLERGAGSNGMQPPATKPLAAIAERRAIGGEWVPRPDHPSRFVPHLCPTGLETRRSSIGRFSVL